MKIKLLRKSSIEKCLLVSNYANFEAFSHEYFLDYHSKTHILCIFVNFELRVKIRVIFGTDILNGQGTLETFRK